MVPNARFVINTNGTRLLREKDLKQLKTVENVFLRFSVDGWGAFDEWTRQDTVWEEKLQVMDLNITMQFKLKVWDITANSLSVRHIIQLIKYYGKISRC